MVEHCSRSGLKLAWVGIPTDDRARIVEITAAPGKPAGDWCIFSCGGIGATPDDHTRQAAAEALGVPLNNAEAEREIRARAVMNWELTP